MRITLTLTAPLDLGGTTVRLKPGVNEVSPEAWAQVEASPITRHYVQSGAVVVERPASEEKGEPSQPKKQDGKKQKKGAG